MSHVRYGLAAGILALAGTVMSAQPPSLQPVPPPDGTWTADATVRALKVVTDSDLGAGQGVSLLDGRLYFYGDVVIAKPRTGVIREYSADLAPTGRVFRLTRNGTPIILHPTGLTRDSRFGTFLGDTVSRRARIYRLDWERAWRDGNLDGAVRNEIEDDPAINGCRPTFVTVAGRTFLASADYGDIRAELRLYDPGRIVAEGRTSAPGVVAHRVLIGPWNQNLHWDAASGQLTCIQNVLEGRGWRLDRLDLAKALADGRASATGVRLGTATFFPHDELEGYLPLEGGTALFVTSSRRENILLGAISPVPPRPSPPPQPVAR